MHGFYTYREDHPGGRDPRFHEVGPWGMRPTSYDDLELVAHWKRYLDSPMRYLRRVLGD